jgi:hypothetical protein
LKSFATYGERSVDDRSSTGSDRRDRDCEGDDATPCRAGSRVLTASLNDDDVLMQRAA